MNHYFAANRFGYGAKISQQLNSEQSVADYLLSQLAGNLLEEQGKLPSSDEISNMLMAQRMAKKAAEEKGEVGKFNQHRQVYLEYSGASVNALLNTDNDFAWRVVDFFSNHFSVSAQGRVMTALAPTLEREAIIPHINGTFSDMLMAVETHPAMLVYLNNEKSFGPNSKVGKRRDKGFNENLAREILELHTLGVNGGYQQADVKSLALAITGWSVYHPTKEKKTGFNFREKGHEPGKKALLGKSYSQLGFEQGKAMLADLAKEIATIHHLCYKLARHFIADSPSDRAVYAMEQCWKANNGNIPKVLEAMIIHSDAQIPKRLKFKTGREFMISALRASGITSLKAKKAVGSLSLLGQQPFKAGSPKGYSDKEMDWNGPSALMTRIEWTNQVSKKYRHDIEPLIIRVFAQHSNEDHIKAVKRAESKQQAVALALLSPEFLRR